MKTFDQDRLVQLLYDAADDEHDLCGVLTAMGETVGSARAHYIVVSRETGAPVEVRFIGGEAEDFDRYEGWRDQDPRFALAMARMGDTLLDADLPDLRAFERSALFNEELLRAGTRYSLFATQDAGPAFVMAQAFLRGPYLRRSDRPFDEEERRRMQTLLPHLARATRLRHLVRALRADLEDVERSLDALPTAVAVLETGGRVVARNASFRELSAAHPDLLRERRVIAAIGAAASFADRSRARSPSALPPRTIQIARTDAPPLSVLVHPLRSNVELRRAVPRARVVVVVHDPSRVLRLDPALIAELHGLTATEAELAATLAEGRTLAEFAAARGTSELTARTHLKRVLDKTGARRQPELVRMLVSAAALHRFA